LNAMAPEGVAEPSLPPARHGARSRWLVALWIILAAGVIGALAYQFYFADRIPALAFRATDTDGQIHVEWDHKSPGIRDAERGVLEITDGGPKVEYPLTADTLRTGGYVYMRHSDDVNLRLTVYRPKKNPLSEGSRFLGQPTSRAFADEIGRLIVERNQVRAEKEDEQKKLEAERARTRLLQQQVRILQQQVDVLRNQIRTQ
ncbi:MAG: hypothetical protein NTY38_21270, partial [Acidobacteria bacterium]|nr:hypothetical protein [Acidobacteriota bacterium]